jgi:iron complex transport system substrate-binding protein
MDGKALSLRLAAVSVAAVLFAGGIYPASRGALAEGAKRIVSIGGSVTEILYALGAERSIIAVDTTSLYPPQALKEKPNVGYMRALSAEGVLGLSPSMIIAIEGSGPKDTIDLLQHANVLFLTVPDSFTSDGILEKIRTVARDVDETSRGSCLVAAVKRDLAALDRLRQQIRQPVKVAFVLSLTNGRPMIAGHGTAADGIIALAGARNAFGDFEGYKLVSDEGIVNAKPDVILVMQRSGLNLSADDVFSLPSFAITPAAERKDFIAMEGLYLLGFGPRTPRAAYDLAQRLYPDLKPDEPLSADGPDMSSCGR